MGEAAKSLQRSGDLVATAGSALLNLVAYAPTLRLHGPLRVITVSLNKDAPSLLSTLKWNADGLIPAIVQDATTGDVLMMAWMNSEALEQTIERGETVFYSRSRRTLWRKGETSGHVQAVVSVHVDCDADTVLIKVHQRGGACHLGYRSCFFRRVNQAGELEIAGDLVFDAEVVYRTDRRPVAGAGLALSHAHAEAPKSVIPATDAASPPSS